MKGPEYRLLGRPDVIEESDILSPLSSRSFWKSFTIFPVCQRCRVDFTRNALSHVPKLAVMMVAATIRTVFAQPDAGSTREQWRRVADSFRDRFSRLTELMDEVKDDALAYATFPVEHLSRNIILYEVREHVLLRPCLG